MTLDETEESLIVTYSRRNTKTRKLLKKSAEDDYAIYSQDIVQYIADYASHHPDLILKQTAALVAN